jgi:hypothetical protein
LSKQPRNKDGTFGVIHGAQSSGIRKRFSDKRTAEGKELEQVMGAIVEDFGGLEQLSGHQMSLLMIIQEKLMVILPVKKWLEEQLGNLVDKENKLPPVLERSYLQWLNGLEQTLNKLYSTMERKKGLTPEEWRKSVLRVD